MYYLKYRPKKFAELFGLEKVVSALRNALAKGKVAHAYVFTGPKGSGKTTTARILAKALNCERLGYCLTPSGRLRESDPLTPGVGEARSLPSQAEPCNECSACLAVNEGRFLDLLEIDAASHRGIDDVRDLREKIKLAPTFGKYKIYLIDEAQMLTLEAFNALLKTLEEPPAHAVFILATTELNKLPETIRSRCQILRFEKARRTDLLKKLEFIGQAEGVTLERSDLEKIATLAEGGFRNAETLLEQLIVGELKPEGENLSPANLTRLISEGAVNEALTWAEDLGNRGERPGALLPSLLSYWRLLLFILSNVSAEALQLNAEEFEDLKLRAQNLGREKLVFLIERFLKVEDQLRFSSLPQLPLELAILEASERLRGSSFDSDESVAEDSSRGLILEDETSERVPEDKPFEFDLEEVSARWDELLKAVKPFNHSLEALLRATRPKEILAEGRLRIEVFYKFHREKLGQSRNLNILSQAFTQVFGAAPRLEFVLGEKPKSRPSEEIVAAALQAFGG